MRNTWPSGSYGLPKPKSGCPSKEWLEGFRYQDSENVENTNTKTNGSHFSGRVTPHGIRQEFCIHKGTPGKRIPWPSGKYCIYRKGNSCPTGLREGDSHMKGHHPTWEEWNELSLQHIFKKKLSLVNDLCSASTVQCERDIKKCWKGSFWSQVVITKDDCNSTESSDKKNTFPKGCRNYTFFKI